MKLVTDLFFGSDAESRHATPERSIEIGEVNTISQFIGEAFLVALIGNDFKIGKVKKIIIELRKSMPKKPDGEIMILENMIDVIRFNVEFEFNDYLRMTLKNRCEKLFTVIYQSLIDVCNIFDISVEAVNSAAKLVESQGFIYKYKIGKPIMKNSVNLAAQLVSISSPLSMPKTLLGAEVHAADSGKTISSCVFFENIRVHQYGGKLKWVSENELVFVPKSVALHPVKAMLQINKDIQENLVILH